MDEALLRAINAWSAEPWVAALGVAFSSRWVMLCLVPVGLAVWRQGRWIAVLSVVLAMSAGDSVSSQLIKPVVDRARPCHVLSGLERPVSCGPGKSFPSAHASVSFAFLTATAPMLRLGWWILTPLAAGVAGSRVVLGVHYPSDVAFGAGLGASLGSLASYLRRRLQKPKQEPNP